MSWGFRSFAWRGDPDPGSLPGMLAAYPQVGAAVEARLAASLDAVRDVLRAWRLELDAALVERETLSGSDAASVMAAAVARATVRIVGCRREAPPPQ